MIRAIIFVYFTNYTLKLGLVTFKKLLPKVLQILATKQYEPDAGDLILQAFRTLDTQNRGYLTQDDLELHLTSKGTAFRPTELDAFFLVAKDPDTGNIYYEDYVASLKKDQKF